jgi:superfamily I DNA and/or RNA helicase
VLSREAQEGGLGVSLFERLLAQHGDDVRVMLREQYRMHEQIMQFPSSQMYGGQLRAHPSVARHELAALLQSSMDAPPLLFLDTAGKGWDEEQPAGSDSHRNPGEGELVLDRLAELLAAGLPPSDVAVITPYGAQVDWLRQRAVERGLAPTVEIDTVDSFQGREKEAVLVSLVRANSDGTLGFLTDLRRMNVAITRARRHLFVVGDSATLGRHPFYERFIAVAQEQGGYRSAWDWPASH